MNRRSVLGLLAGIVPLCLGRQPCVQQVTAGEESPWDSENWTRVFSDQFDADSLDTDTWGIGWGWGRETSTSDTEIRPDNVSVRDDSLVLTGGHEGSAVYSGAVNTKNTVTFGPGSHLEAEIRFADRVGFQNAFWAKPNSEAWPPELDVVELWQRDDMDDSARTSRHHLHYSRSTTPGDRETYVDVGVDHRPGDNLTENFHQYGVEWRTDRLVHYVDREPIHEWDSARLLAAMGAGSPLYLMFSLNINNIGTADISVEWGESMAINEVRLWQYDPTDQSPDGEHYLWLRSATGDPAAFVFRVSGGNVSIEDGEETADYWVSDDGRIAGGLVARESGLPGFMYEGEITAFTFEGPLEVFLDDDPVDPAVLPTDSSS